MKLILILIILSIITVLLCVFYDSKPTDINIDPKPDQTEVKTGNSTKTEKPNTKKADKAIPNLPQPAERKDENPAINGLKERTATISQKNELYLDELVLEREKATSIIPMPLRPKEPFIKWVMQFSGSVAGAIAIKENKLYFGTYDYQAFVVKADTGEVISQVKTVSQPINSTRIYKDLFLVPQRNGQVTAFSIADGKEKWNHRSAVDKTTTEIDLSISGIQVFGNRFYVSKHWGNLYIGNADTGVLDHDVGVTYESRINLPAIKTEDSVLFSNIGGEIHCFKDDGSENWHFTLPKGYALSMCLVGNTLFIATTEKELIALNLKDRSIFWIKELAGFGYDSMTYYKNVLFIQAKNIYAFEPSKGKLQWQIHSKSEEGFCRGAPIITNDNLYAVEQSGRLISAGLNDGAVTKDFDFKETIRSPVAFAEEILYIATTQKRIYAIDIKRLK